MEQEKGVRAVVSVVTIEEELERTAIGAGTLLAVAARQGAPLDVVLDVVARNLLTHPHFIDYGRPRRLQRPSASSCDGWRPRRGGASRSCATRTLAASSLNWSKADRLRRRRTDALSSEHCRNGGNCSDPGWARRLSRPPHHRRSSDKMVDARRDDSRYRLTALVRLRHGIRDQDPVWGDAESRGQR